MFFYKIMSIFGGGLKIIDYKDEKGNKEQIKKQPVFVCMNISTTFTACEG